MSNRLPKSTERPLWQKLVAAGALATAGLNLAACGEGSASASQPTPSETVATAPASPSPSETPAVAETPSSSPSETANPMIESMKGLSAEEFAKFPQADRVDYVLAVYHDISETGALYDFTNQDVGNGQNLAKYNPYRKPLGSDANGQDIWLQNMFAEQIVKATKSNIHTAGNGPNDKVQAMKMVSGYSTGPDSAEYASLIDTVSTSDTIGRIDESTIQGGRVLETSPVEKNPDGTFAKTIILNLNGNTWRDRYVFAPNTSLGANKGLWLLDTSEKVELSS